MRRNVVFMQGLNHVVDMVGQSQGAERADICRKLLDSLGRSGHPQDHKNGVKYAAETLLGIDQSQTVA